MIDEDLDELPEEHQIDNSFPRSLSSTPAAPIASAFAEEVNAVDVIKVQQGTKYPFGQ